MGTKKQNSTEDLLDRLKQGESKAIKEVYIMAYPSCANLVLNNSGTKNDAQDVFQDALMVVIRKLKDPDFELTCHIKTYLYSVLRNLWLKELRKRGKTGLELIVDEPESGLPIIQEDELEEKLEIEAKHQHIAKILGSFKEDCKKLLLAFYFKKMPLKEIAQLMDYSDSFVKVKKKRCMDSLKKKVLETYQATEQLK